MSLKFTILTFKIIINWLSIHDTCEKYIRGNDYILILIIKVYSIIYMIVEVRNGQILPVPYHFKLHPIYIKKKIKIPLMK